MSQYRVNYLATDGEVRHTTVEADNEEHAKEVAMEEDGKINSCGDNINQIISVDNA